MVAGAIISGVGGVVRQWEIRQDWFPSIYSTEQLSC